MAKKKTPAFNLSKPIPVQFALDVEKAMNKFVRMRREETGASYGPQALIKEAVYVFLRKEGYITDDED